MIGKLNSQKGSVLVLAFIISIAFTLAVLAFQKVIDARARQGVYYTSKKGAYELAVTGLNAAMGQLIRASDPVPFNAAQVWVDVPSLKGKYKNEAARISTAESGNKPVNYYIKTLAEVNKNGHIYKTTLHSYVQLSNIGEYFAAIKGSLSISDGVNAPGGRIYGENLTFSIPPSGGPVTTRIRGAEFLNTSEPVVNEGSDLNSYADNTWTGVNPADPNNRLIVNPNPLPAGFTINDGSPPFGMPRHVKAALVFPQVLGPDIVQYCADALPGDRYTVAVATLTGNFSSGANKSRIICNDYTAGNVKGKLVLSNITVSGQILFVSTGGIEIQGNILKNFAVAAGHDANQAILMTRDDVLINHITPTPTIDTTQTIQAMVVAPNGALIPQPYPDPTVHGLLSLVFNGSMILARVSSNVPFNFPTIYQGINGRQYIYDDTLRTAPPPQLPVVSKVWFLFEEVGYSSGLIN